MRTIKIITLFIFIAGMNASCSAQSSKNDESPSAKKADDVQVYYFHYARRCASCRTVEKESKKAVEELYGDKVSFSNVNLDTPEGEQIGEAIGVSGQTLLINKGNTKIEITNEGFMYSRNNPEKLKQIIKEKIDPLL
ncbi:MAG: nitrophenyl compound nitroreductase subunit ArsF family protein [Bacteroidota bacterium]|nr:nitrophenyl compound nitroreductase subunit ArsF family protein [Bacteroidota bacterium]